MLTFAVNNFNACSKIFFTCLQTNWCISESDVSTLTRTSTEKFNLTGFSALKSKDLLLSVFKSSNLPVLSSLNVNSPMSDFGRQIKVEFVGESYKTDFKNFTTKKQPTFFQFLDNVFSVFPFWESSNLRVESSLSIVEDWSWLSMAVVWSANDFSADCPKATWKLNLILTPSAGMLKVSLFLTVVRRVDNFWALIVFKNVEFNLTLVNFFNELPAGSSQPTNSMLGGKYSKHCSKVDWSLSPSFGAKTTLDINFLESFPKNNAPRLSVPNSVLAFLKF